MNKFLPSGRRTRGTLLCIGIVGILIAGGGCATRHAASPDMSSATTPLELGRLSVRPNAMASGTQTVLAGVQRLDSLYGGDSLLHGSFVYVPKRCVGMRRVPLVVLLHGSGGDGLELINWDHRIFQTFADSNAVILLGLTSRSADGGWGNIRDTAPRNVDVPRMDAAIRQVLHHYAIDPTRIALLGESAGAGAALDFGLVNGNVFSRVILFSTFDPFYGIHEFDGLRRHGMPAIYIGFNSRESSALNMPAFVSWLRRTGYSVNDTGDNGGHSLGRSRTVPGLTWLAESWHLRGEKTWLTGSKN